ncbi:MAG: hypothetical protein ACD_41C00097G0003 [uncultured bacterium]|nr:MAG: hypothetical protein ACD_41C00097G0003 [uncultured bacterium]HBY74179.1 hypothetical protein [Candidatus Kerfeldbacteria bacterium]
MNALIVQWFQLSGWKLLVILVIWLISNYAVNRFGQQFISLILTKERAVLRQRHRALSTHDQQRIATLSSVLSKVMRAAIVIVFGSMILTELGIPVGPIFAGAGILGITIGFGAQSVIKDVLAGLFIVLENQYARGDRIKLGEITGMVEDVSLRTTVIRSADQVLHYIPNGSITVISNYSKEV